MQEMRIQSLSPGRSPGGGCGNPLQYSCLGNPMDRGAWWATVHGVAKSRTQLKQLSTSMHPLQCSCLENPRDRGACWAAIYGVAQSRTRLKRLSTSMHTPATSECFPLPFSTWEFVLWFSHFLFPTTVFPGEGAAGVVGKGQTNYLTVSVVNREESCGALERISFFPRSPAL